MLSWLELHRLRFKISTGITTVSAAFLFLLISSECIISDKIMNFVKRHVIIIIYIIRSILIIIIQNKATKQIIIVYKILIVLIFCS